MYVTVMISIFFFKAFVKMEAPVSVENFKLEIK